MVGVWLLEHPGASYQPWLGGVAGVLALALVSDGPAKASSLSKDGQLEAALFYLLDRLAAHLACLFDLAMPSSAPSAPGGATQGLETVLAAW